MYLGLVVTVGSEQSLLQGLLLDPESSCASASLVGCPLRGQFPSSVFPLSSHTDEDSHDPCWIPWGYYFIKHFTENDILSTIVFVFSWIDFIF